MSAFLSESPLCSNAGTFCHRTEAVFRLREIHLTYEVLCGAFRPGDFSEVMIFAVFDAGMIVVVETVTEP